MNYIRKKTVVFSCIVTTILLFSVFGISSFINSNINSKSSELDSLNELLRDLDHPLLNYSEFNNNALTTLPIRIKYFLTLRKELSNREQYENQKLEIINEFDESVTLYIEKVKAFPEINLAFLPSDLSDIQFDLKKDKDFYLSNLKIQFKANIVTYNETTDNPLRFVINPEEEVKTLSVKEKAAMLFGFSINGTDLTFDEDFLRNYHPSSVILFGDNISDENQLRSLTSEIQQTNPKYPVLINTDQEGGDVSRIYWDSTESLKTIDEMNAADQCTIWNNRSKLLSGLGINWNLGIVADVSKDENSFIYSRTFSEDYNKAASDVATAVECSPEVLSTLKHYPGHGGTSLDTHQQIGTLDVLNEKDWLNSDAIPFKAGLNADSIMMGHLVMTWLDSEKPASLSKIQADYLRNTLGYKGLLVTDDLMMLTEDGYTINEAVKEALLAGNDILLATIADSRREELIDQAKEMINNNEIEEHNIDSRIIRIFTKMNKIIESYDKFVLEELVY